MLAPSRLRYLTQLSALVPGRTKLRTPVHNSVGLEAHELNMCAGVEKPNPTTRLMFSPAVTLARLLLNRQAIKFIWSILCIS